MLSMDSCSALREVVLCPPSLKAHLKGPQWGILSLKTMQFGQPPLEGATFQLWIPDALVYSHRVWQARWGCLFVFGFVNIFS